MSRTMDVFRRRGQEERSPPRVGNLTVAKTGSRPILRSASPSDGYVGRVADRYFNGSLGAFRDRQ